MKQRIIIGIDPDVDANGVGVVSLATNPPTVSKQSMKLPQLVDWLRMMRGISEIPLTVIVEAGWLCQSNWHLGARDSRAVAAAKGRQTGRNHQVGMDICAFLSHLGIEHIKRQPLTKSWKGKDRKITHDEINRVVSNITGAPLCGKTNQEERDALLLAIYESGLPIRI